MRQLVPSLGKGRGKFLGIIMEPLRDLCIRRVHFQRHVCGEHHRRMGFLRIMRIRHSTLGIGVRGCPLLRAGRALGQFPLVPEQIVEIAV